MPFPAIFLQYVMPNLHKLKNLQQKASRKTVPKSLWFRLRVLTYFDALPFVTAPNFTPFSAPPLSHNSQEPIFLRNLFSFATFLLVLQVSRVTLTFGYLGIWRKRKFGGEARRRQFGRIV